MVLSSLVLLVSGYAMEFLVLAGSLFFHELGHMLGASFAGSEISRIDIWPFGAIGKLEYAWQIEPRAEMSIAIGGPLSSAFLASLGSFVKMGLGELAGPVLRDGYPLLNLLIEANLRLFAVNLLPCLPLDGGRILRSHLALKTGYLDASRKMTGLGKLLGISCTLLGAAGALLGKPTYILLIAGPLILWGAIEEKENTALDYVREILKRNERLKRLKAIPIEELLVSENARVRDVVKRLKPSKYHMIIVARRDMKIAAKLTETQILEAFYTGKACLKLKDLAGQAS